VFTFGGLLNALAMIAPVHALEELVIEAIGSHYEWPALLSLFIAVLFIVPLVLLGVASRLTRRTSRGSLSLTATAVRFSRSLVPLGVGIWLAHYGFHFFTGFLTIVPVTQSVMIDWFGTPLLGEPRWQLSGLPESVTQAIELGVLSLGLIGSCLASWAIVRELGLERRWSSFFPGQACTGRFTRLRSGSCTNRWRCVAPF
jgi:hypothetical protein